MNYETLKERCKVFIDATGAKTTKFCEKCGLSPSMYYKWQANMTPLSDSKAACIEQFLESFGF